MTRDRDEALALVPVSRETTAKLGIFVDLLERWQAVKNLVAPSTLTRVWTRHVADSAQLLALAADATHWLDLGSGAGFPGLVLAIQLAEIEGGHVTLIESDKRKCAFLRAVIRETGAPATLVAGRIETEMSRQLHPQAVTARALAPLSELIRLTEMLLMEGTVGVFPKGRDVDRELTGDSSLRRFAIDLIPSRTDPEARVVLVRRADPQGTRAQHVR